MSDWQSVLDRAIEHLHRDDGPAARAFLKRAATADAPPPVWLLLADARARCGDTAGQEPALDEALRRDGRYVPALLAKGELAAARGDDRAAVSFLGLALTHAPAQGPPGLIERLARARDTVAAAGKRFSGHLDARLVAAGLPADRPPRFTEAIDILKGGSQP